MHTQLGRGQLHEPSRCAPGALIMAPLDLCSRRLPNARRAPIEALNTTFKLRHKDYL